MYVRAIMGAVAAVALMGVSACSVLPTHGPTNDLPAVKKTKHQTASHKKTVKPSTKPPSIKQQRARIEALQHDLLRQRSELSRLIAQSRTLLASLNNADTSGGQARRLAEGGDRPKGREHHAQIESPKNGPRQNDQGSKPQNHPTKPKTAKGNSDDKSRSGDPGPKPLPLIQRSPPKQVAKARKNERNNGVSPTIAGGPYVNVDPSPMDFPAPSSLTSRAGDGETAERDGATAQSDDGTASPYYDVLLPFSDDKTMDKVNAFLNAHRIKDRYADHKPGEYAIHLGLYKRYKRAAERRDQIQQKTGLRPKINVASRTSDGSNR